MLIQTVASFLPLMVAHHVSGAFTEIHTQADASHHRK